MLCSMGKNDSNDVADQRKPWRVDAQWLLTASIQPPGQRNTE